MPQTCTELTNRVCALTPQVLYANRCHHVMLVEEDEDLSEVEVGKLCNSDAAKRIYSRPAWSYEVDFIHSKATVIFDAEPRIAPLGELKVKLSVLSQLPDPRNITFKWHLPEGWSVEGPGRAQLRHYYPDPQHGPTVCEFTIKAGERVEPFTRLIVEAASPGRPSAGLIPVTVLGA